MPVAALIAQSTADAIRGFATSSNEAWVPKRNRRSNAEIRIMTGYGTAPAPVHPVFRVGAVRQATHQLRRGARRKQRKEPYQADLQRDLCRRPMQRRRQCHQPQPSIVRLGQRMQMRLP